MKNPTLSAPVKTLLFTLLLGLGLRPVHALDEAPPKTALVEKKLDQLSNTSSSPNAALALAIKPEKWRHAETENFIIHYRRATEAQKVVHDIEYHLWFVAKTLGATKERYQRKSHVFIFEDQDEWKAFLAQTNSPQWFASFARGDELFLNVRQPSMGGRFDPHLLAHETTHAVVARLYPSRRWPLWLSEGFAEYMGGVSVSARKGFSDKHYQGTLGRGDLPWAELTTLTVYPKEKLEVSALYQSSERLVRFLMNGLPKERFPQFVDQILGGQDFESAFLTVYGDRISSIEAFDRKYERFVK